MSDLQIGLIILGLVLILVVMLFNWWQDWRARAHMRQRFPDTQDDALFDEFALGERREPVLGAALNTSVVGEDGDEVDARCEAVIDIHFPHPIAADALTHALQSLLRAGEKPIRVFAQRDDDGKPARVHLGEPCIALHLAVLLANRSGPLSAIAWSSIWTQAQALATQFDGTIEGPEQDQVVRQAAQLDALCADLDATVNLQVKLPEALPLEQIQRLAQDVGFVPQGRQLVWMVDDMARFTLRAANDAVQDAVATQRAARLDLVLDVPNSPSDPQAFSRMAGVGRDLASRLNAVLLDDQGKPLAAHADAVVDRQLTQIAQSLDAAGFPPGSARCARVFA